MANITKVFKKSGARAAKPLKAGDSTDEYAFQDNMDGSFDIFGVDQAGAQVDISGVATLDPPPSSDDTKIVLVDPPNGFHVACHGVAPGSATVTVTATWNDGSVGPFTITVPCKVGTGPVTGLGVSFGAPTIRG